MKRVRIQRPVRLLERHWPWALLSLSVGLFLAGVTALLAAGALDGIDAYWFGRNFRGYTANGIAMGILAVALTACSVVYSIRKRRASSGTASMMTWLWIHVYVGLLATFAAVLHAGFGIFSLNMSTGKLLFFLFALISFSGVVWRLAYAFVPALAAPEVLNYSQQGAEKRAEEQKTEIEKLAAGKSPEFRRLKDALLAREMGARELALAAQSFHPQERATLDEIAALAASCFRALRRVHLQAKYTRLLQGWRALHVPVTFFFAVALVAHIFGALGIVARAMPVSGATTGALATYKPSEDCRGCHSAIYASWADSMHAHALTSPVTVVQNNLDEKTTLAGQSSRDVRRICINCHAPAGAAITEGETLPLGGGPIPNEGINCVACHQHRAPVTSGSGGFASFQAKLEQGSTYFGELASPIGNAFHKSETSPSYGNPNDLCSGCHDVHLDRDNDGKIVKGKDLVLQTTFDEFKEYAAAGGKGTCVTCHMPALRGVIAAADGAQIPLEQDFEGPDRLVHDHGFAGVDYPLDTVAKSDPQKAKRAALLAGAASLTLDEVKVDGATMSVRVSIENQAGHNLPTGFAFARQMWLEVVVRDAANVELFASGKLEHKTDDLCDNGTFGDARNPLRPGVVGCAEVDKQLVNIQLKLVDKITVAVDASGAPTRSEDGDFVVIPAKDGVETFLQYITGGAVGRARPSDKVSLAPLKPGAKRTFSYTIPIAHARSGSVSARLLFRNLPPYWLRGMAKAQPAGGVRIEPLIANLQVVEMARKSASFTR